MPTYIYIIQYICMHTHDTHTYMHMCVRLCSTSSAVIYNSRVILVFISFFFFFLHCHELSSFAFLVQWGRVTNRSYNLSENRNKIVEKSNNSSKCLLHALNTHTQASTHTHTHMHTKCNGGNCCLWLGIFFCILFVVWVRVVLPFKNSRSCSADIFL